MSACSCGRPCWACAQGAQALAWRLDVGGTFLAGAMAALAAQVNNLHLCNSHRDMFDQLAPIFNLRPRPIGDEHIPKEWN